ncbi:MAG TPA: hypothetical protein DEH25_16515 [Chloroflexi bacterium]|nr:hypothetical protein [Chloroflexota bacterium]
MPDSDYFLELQINTGWGRVLTRFADWIGPEVGGLTLDVGCGPGLLPALLAQRGCRALGIDRDPEMFIPAPLHPQVITADGSHPPFPAHSFDLITASNLLFLLPDPGVVLQSMTQFLRPGGQVATLNPTEKLTITAATQMSEAVGLTGLARESLLNWAVRAENHFHWTESETIALFHAAGLELVETKVTMGSGFARFARGMLVYC